MVGWLWHIFQPRVGSTTKQFSGLMIHDGEAMWTWSWHIWLRVAGCGSWWLTMVNGGWWWLCNANNGEQAMVDIGHEFNSLLIVILCESTCRHIHQISEDSCNSSDHQGGPAIFRCTRELAAGNERCWKSIRSPFQAPIWWRKFDFGRCISGSHTTGHFFRQFLHGELSN